MKKIIVSLIVLSLFLVSCEIEVEPRGPVSNEQLTEMVKKDPDKVLGPMLSGAVTYMYNGYREDRHDRYGFKIWNLALDMMGNDMLLMNTTNWFSGDYMLDDYRTELSTRPMDDWHTYYSLIYKANQILDLMPEDAIGRALVYKAQALTLRSLAYYYLLNLYQDDYMHGGSSKAGVPLYLTVEGAKGRAPVEEVYSQITDDLREAITLFNAQSYNATSDRTDIDQTVANVVLARVLLTTGDYTGAASAADAVIGQYTLMSENDYLNLGLLDVNNSETIWGHEWDMTTSIQNRSFSSFLSPIGTGYGSTFHIAIDSRLYDQIPASDYRKKNFVETPFQHTNADGSVQTIEKYVTMKFAAADYQTDDVYMRVSEMHLLKAEALARGGNDAQAQDALFTLVSQRDASYSKSANTGTALLDEIFLQSRIELWGEGFEFLTNKRFHVGVDRSGSLNHFTPNLKIPAGKGFTFQIPLTTEIERNEFISAEDQNPL